MHDAVVRTAQFKVNHQSSLGCTVCTLLKIQVKNTLYIIIYQLFFVIIHSSLFTVMSDVI